VGNYDEILRRVCVKVRGGDEMRGIFKNLSLLVLIQLIVGSAVFD
jgi:hypothetical protein